VRPGASLGHGQLRRHPHQILAHAEQPPFQPACQLPAVLDRPQPLRVERSRPIEQLVAADRNHRLSQRTTCLVDRDSGHRLLVHVQSNHDHQIASYPLGATGERTDLT
jgi:hypothetical protein